MHLPRHDAAQPAAGPGGASRFALHPDDHARPIVAIGQSEDYEPHTQRHLISNFRVQAASDEELRVQANFHILRTFPEKRSEHFVSGTYDDRIAIAGRRLHFKEKLCVLDSDVPPESLLYPI